LAGGIALLGERYLEDDLVLDHIVDYQLAVVAEFGGMGWEGQCVGVHRNVVPAINLLPVLVM
jgi:hypothetical protein